ncbi:MAG TPA: hypothetical protein VEY91_07955 [Candidatus Limnocylindria bacterium]|nr:hypothetical protein [Candidatus Limnocylindria bacterium]
MRTAELGEKDRILLVMSLAVAPGPNLVLRHAVARGDRHCGGEALPIVPVIESRQPISTSIGRRECQCSRGPLASPYRLDGEILSDPERPTRELDEEANPCVDVAITLPLKAQRCQRSIEIFDGARSSEHEVDI